MLRIVKELTGPVKYAYVFIIVPKRIRDKVYDYVAKHRHKFMKKEVVGCLLQKREVDF